MTPGTKANSNNPLSRQQGNAAFQEARRVVGVSARDQVMIEFQRTSLEMAKRFMEAQQNVMLAYLGAQGQTNSFNSEFIDLAVQSQSAWVQSPVNYAVSAEAPVTNPTVQYESNKAAVVKVEPAIVSNEIVVAPMVAEAAAVPANGGSNGKSNGANTEVVSLVKSGNNGSGPLSPSSTTSGASNAPDAEQLVASLIEIVSERTGYPPEMLDPELDLEADLGIDSIKRVEILNNFRKLLPESTQSVLEEGIERLAGVKTLAGIIDWIRNDLDLGGSSSNSTAINSLSLAPGSAETSQMQRELV